MATANVNDWSTVERDPEAASEFRAGSLAWQALAAIGSLKLTVVLFALSSVLVLVGTLAQEDLNMVEVKQRYFTSWIAAMRLEDFVPQAFIRHQTIPGVIPFPGGALIGVLLMANLIAAKVTRFHIRASGGRLLGGAIVFLFGLLLCYGVIAAGHSSDGVQGQPPISYQTLWSGLVGGMAVLWVAAVYRAIVAPRTGWRIIWGSLALVTGIFGVATLLGYFSMSASSLRITWQLIQGTIVAAVLLVGSLLMFGKQGGNLLLHFGVALLMIGQFAFGDQQLEQRLSLVEGEATNTLVNMDRLELAMIDRSKEGIEAVTAVPEATLRRLHKSGETLRDARLPVDVRVVEFFPNSTLIRSSEAKGENLATTGNGERVVAVPQDSAGGVSSEVDLASAYVELLDKESGESLGTYLVSQLLNDRQFLAIGSSQDMFDSFTAGGQEFDLGLRFSRVAKPYWVKLKDVRRVNYSGTDTPRDYSSFITLVDTETGQVRDERVWMNNPLRYRGETFYQSSYQPLPGGKEMTGIQVVKNSGWMIPYIACMVVAVGMIAHFTGTLDRFLGRRERETKRVPVEGAKPGSGRWPVVLMTGLAALLAALALVPWSAVSMAMRPERRQEAFDLYRAGEIPTRYGGRVMPLDAFARQTLRAISNKTSLPLEEAEESSPGAPGEIIARAGDASKLSALQWLLEVASGDPALRDLPMFRIEADEVLAEFSIKRRRSMLYSLAELAPGLENFQTQLRAAEAKEPEQRTFTEQKLMELASRLNAYRMVDIAFGEPALPSVPEEFRGPNVTPEQQRQAQFMLLARQMSSLREAPVPAVVPPTAETTSASQDVPPWTPLASGLFFNAISSVTGEPAAPGTETFSAIVRHYNEGNEQEFNEAVDRHLAVVAELEPRDYRPAAVGVERWLEAVQPTVTARIFYGLFLVLGLLGLMIDLPRLRWSVWGGLAVVAVVHTFVLLARMYVTGRAPVINLYSSAVFIGWAAVLAGLLLELVYRRGVGNVIAASTGLLSLMVAWFLNTGDTMPVLQAVLDTQFWLGTHVITIALGYAATFLAGGLGIVYLFGMLGRAGVQTSLARDVYRMIYGVTCFAILFSFVGTVLGGLWADDSWGRFWGWDPKENGALLIVLWNALMLHARWDGMVRERGFALLAIGGNIITAWSWFGTNQLGIGLHSYGFTSGALALLSVFVASQLGLIILGAILLRPSGEAK
ncbi:cytochrome c biogenesis protein CcsA [Candidatus Laterigemmans baculatus]|uniref:cytochrome c biogenesis protein CcsA n=1 Tax=Candidatus Laterigemmans baculatus TaxID=2770505 RepID=UPI0013DD78F2|nr:cytochrome c biogenesis protein CcsA [Candidatus Laterigemmans baculatus]